MNFLIFLFAVGSIIFLILSAYSLSRPPTESMGLLIPIFSHVTMSEDWNKVIESKKAQPSVKMITIVNPASGSGLNRDSHLAEGVKKMQDVNIDVIGYVPTTYGKRNIEDAKLEIENYKSWYAVDGIFFDEVRNQAGSEEYYQELVDHAKSLNLKINVGNPGIPTDVNYEKIFDILIVYEIEGIPDSVQLENISKEKNLAILAFNVDSPNEEYLKAVPKNVDWIFFTNASLPNPWEYLPPYFNDLVAILARI